MPDQKPFPPLISSRSPSYERARKELAHPSPSGDASVVAVLARLVEAEHDAARATEAAAAAGVELGDAVAEHAARAGALGQLIGQLGGSAPRPEESRDILSNGAAAVAGAGDPASVIRAMRDELAAAYGEAARDPSLSPEQRAAIQALAPR